MTSCTAAARSVKTDAAARTEQERATMRTGAFWFTSTYTLQPSTAHGKVQQPSTVCIRQDHPFVGSKTRTDADHHRPMTKAPTVTPAFERRPWKVQQRDHVSSTQLNEMTSCTAAAHAGKPNAAARMEQERGTPSTDAYWLPSTHKLQRRRYTAKYSIPAP